MSASIAVGAPSGGPLVTLLVATIFIIIMLCFFFSSSYFLSCKSKTYMGKFCEEGYFHGQSKLSPDLDIA